MCFNSLKLIFIRGFPKIPKKQRATIYLLSL